ncbi:hypothetical protein OAM56_04680 [Alphaproteobacteria bacterium]|nr:hypothetical protein [Alphaproteobacteria bacterium]
MLATVNNLPITKFDVINKAKIISFSIEQDLKFTNLKSFYNQSLKTLTDERIIEASGLLINKNINSIVYNQAYQLTLKDFNNSENKLNEFIDKLSIPKSTILDKFKSQLIWSVVLRDRFKLEIKDINKKSKEIFRKENARSKKTLYDLAEIVLEKKGNTQLLKNINLALKQGSNFLEIAKQVSISDSAKFKGKIGWKTYENLPTYIVNKKIKINEGDIISFPAEGKIRIIKILVKRNNGRLSEIENKVLLAQVDFEVNFQDKQIAYIDVKKRITKLLSKKGNCTNLKTLNNNKELNLKIIDLRIADLSLNVQKIIKNKNLYEISEPIFFGNNGFIYITCDKQKAKLVKNNFAQIKKNIMEKQFRIFSEKLIKKLKKQANIINIEKIK